MIGISKDVRKSARIGFAALGLAAMSLPLANALAQDEAPAELTAEQVASARETFNNFSCGACHTLGDAGASGQIGPSLDGDANLDHDYIVGRVTNGQGAMPGFGGQIADEDIDLLARYIMQVKK